MNQIQCVHGNLKRSCQICDQIAEIDSLHSQLAETKQRLVVEEAHSEKYRAELAEAQAKLQEYVDPKRLVELGWQAIECPVCGGSAQAYPAQEQMRSKVDELRRENEDLRSQLAEALAKLQEAERENEQLRAELAALKQESAEPVAWLWI